MRSKIWLIVIGLGAVGVVGFIGYSITRPDTPSQQVQDKKVESKSSDPNVVSENGLHYHPQLAIYVNGEKVTIPTNIGLSEANHKSPHTHDEKGELHWENEGRVTKDDLRLGKLFENWGKPFSRSQLLDKTDSTGSKITMTVNGQPNTEFGDHLVADKEAIEIKYQD